MTARKEKTLGALRRWGAFLGIAAGVLFVVLLPFLCSGKYLVWQVDGVTQHATFLQYMFRGGMFSGVGGYDYNIGLGADYLTSFAYYMLFDPVNLLLYILPRGNILLAYSFLVCVKFLLAAVCMYAYLRHKNIRQTLSVIFAVAYMLSGYMLYSFLRHPDLTAGAMYLPLVAWGIEVALDKNRPFLLIASVFVVTISSFYMAYMVTLYAVAYAALYYVFGVHARGEKVRAKRFCGVFFRTAGYYLLGLLLASFVLLPVAYGYLHAARSAAKGFPTYSMLDLFLASLSLFAPVPDEHYSVIMFSMPSLALAFGALAVTRKNPYRILVMALAVGVFFAPFGYLMNLCNYPSNRFVYMLSFSAFVLLAQYLQTRERERPTAEESNAMARGLCTAALVVGNLGLWAGAEWLFQSRYTLWAALASFVAAGALGVSVWGCVRIWRLDFAKPQHLRRFSYGRLLKIFVCTTVGLSLVFCTVYSFLFDDGTRFASLSTAAEKHVAALPKDEFVRLDSISVDYFDKNNRPLNSGYRGTQVYNTMTSGAFSDFLQANNTYRFIESLGSSGLNGRRALQALLSVRYFHCTQSDYLPADFSPADAEGLYQTEDYVPFGTVFSQTVDEELWQALPDVERQYALLGAVAIEGGDAPTDYRPLAQAVETDVKNATVKKNAPVSFALPEAEQDAEVYVSFEIASYAKRMTSLRVGCGDIEIEQRLYPKGSQKFSASKRFLYKLDEKGERVTFRITSGGPISLQNIKLYVAPMDDVRARIAQTKALPHLMDTEFASDGFAGTIDSDGGVMLLPIAYAKGWTATVDGEATQILYADAGLTAIRVPQGAHTVRFSYRTPWLDAGCKLSLASCAVLCALVVWQVTAYFVRRKRKNGQALSEAVSVAHADGSGGNADDGDGNGERS